MKALRRSATTVVLLIVCISVVPIGSFALVSTGMIGRRCPCDVTATGLRVPPLAMSKESEVVSEVVADVVGDEVGDVVGDGASVSLKKSRYVKSKKEISLYDVLGARPKDSAVMLKRRYVALAKNLHPDARMAGATPSSQSSEATFNGFDLREVNAAWQILSDAKERKKYDRGLQAEEISKGVASFFDTGFKVAIPFISGAAGATGKFAVDAGGAVGEGATEAKRKYDEFEQNQKARELERRADAEEARVAALEQQLEHPDREPVLTDCGTDTAEALTMTADEATRIINTFDSRVTMPGVNIASRVEGLRDMERQQTQLKQSRSSERMVDVANEVEQIALQKMEKAKREYESAKLDHQAAVKDRAETIQKQRNDDLAANRADAALRGQKEKVRQCLLRHENKILELEAKDTKQQVIQLKESIKNLRKEALQMQMEANELAET